MTDPHEAPENALEESVRAQLEHLAQHLVWKMGRDEDTGEVVVRVGFASSTLGFAERIRLRAVSDDELQAALEGGELRVQWVEG